MPDRAWKATERRVGALLGGRRVPVTGRQRGSAPDVEHVDYSIEVKHRAKLPRWILEAMDQANKAASGAQLPIVVLHQSGDRFAEALVVIKLENFLALCPIMDDRET